MAARVAQDSACGSADSACGSKVLFYHMFVVFALVERKNGKREKGKYRSAEG
jgi:hypothetical protein